MYLKKWFREPYVCILFLREAPVSEIWSRLFFMSQIYAFLSQIVSRKTNQRSSDASISRKPAFYSIYSRKRDISCNRRRCVNQGNMFHHSSPPRARCVYSAAFLYLPWFSLSFCLQRVSGGLVHWTKARQWKAGSPRRILIQSVCVFFEDLRQNHGNVTRSPGKIPEQILGYQFLRNRRHLNEWMKIVNFFSEQSSIFFQRK